MGKIEATTDRTALSCPVKARISFPVAASHRRAVLSSEQVSTDLPSGLKAKDNRTALSCPVKARIAFPVAASHRRAVLSHDPVSTRAPSGLKPRRVVAKVEWHSGELYPRVGFIVTNMARRGCPLFFLPLGLLQRCTGLIIICLNAKLLVTARCVSASLPRAVRPTATRLARSARAFCSCGEYPNGFFWLLRGGLTTKIGALVDALDNLIAFAPVSGRQAALPAFPRSGVLAGVVAFWDRSPLLRESPILCSCSAQE
jgi:hypothetical protein